MTRTWLWMIPALLIITLLSFHTITEPDMGYHLAGGRWIAQNHSVPQSDPFTYTVPDNPYTDIHWLYQLGAWYLWQWGNAFLYVLIHTLCIVLAVALAMRLSLLTGAAGWLITVLVLLGAVASDHRFSVRPEVISWLLMMILMSLLESWSSNRTRSAGPLFFLPLIMLLWVNIQGIFIVGLAVIFSYVVDDLIRHRRISWSLWTSALASLGAVFINPYGWRGALFPIILSSRLSGKNAFATYIGEFFSPWNMLISVPAPGTHFMLGAYVVLAVSIPVLLLITWRKTPIRYWLLVIIFGVLAAQAIRNIPVFCLVSLPIGAHALASFNWPRRWQRSATVMTLMFTMIFGGLILTGEWHRMTRKEWRPGYSLTNTFLPVDATQFLIDHNLDGRILNELRHGGYLIWKWQHPVFIDGRLEVIQHEFFEYYIQSLKKRSPWKPVNDYDIQIALFSYRVVPGWMLRFMASDDWRLVYRDQENAIFLRNGYRDDIPSTKTYQSQPNSTMARGDSGLNVPGSKSIP